MEDREKTREMLLDEVAHLRYRLADAEGYDTQRVAGAESPAGRGRKFVETVSPLHDLSLLLSLSGVVRHAVSRHRQVFGYRPANLVGRHIREIIPESHYDFFNKAFETAQTGVPVSGFEVGIVKGDGNGVWTKTSFVPLVEGGSAAAVACLVDDVSEVKGTERRRRINEMFLRDILDTSSSITIMATDLDQNILYWNPGAERLLGYTSEEMVGKAKISVIYDRKYTDTIERVEHARRRVLEQKQGTTCDVIEVRKDGRPVWVKLTLTPRLDEQGNVIGILGIGKDITGLKSTETRLNESIKSLRRAMNATIHAMALTVEKRDPYTAGHQHRVADLGRAIATDMGLAPAQIDCIRMGGIIHDLGKVFVPSEILNRPGGLTESEFALIRSHSETGHDIVKYIDFPWNIGDVILLHHERIDGSGYPTGRSGKDIPVEARIVAVADVVESMSSHRPYRPALGLDAALKEVRTYRGTRYDTAVVDSCLRLFLEKGYQLKEAGPWRSLAS